MPLVLKYKAATTIPVELHGLTPQAAAQRSLAEIERFPLQHGNRQVPLAELFDATGSAADGELRLEGDLRTVHGIGASLAAGRIQIEGDVGRHVGSQMTGGEIHVTGSAGDWLGAEMRGGLIHVRGDAGHQAGGAYPGSQRGMNGGTILIDGRAGDELGHTMRRGTVAVGGDVGDGAGFNMLAGSIYVLGRCGAQAGAGMRRGTIGLFGPERRPLLPTFRRAATYQPTFLRFAFLDLRRLGFEVPEPLLARRVTLYHGDFLALGRGEILIGEEE